MINILTYIDGVFMDQSVAKRKQHIFLLVLPITLLTLILFSFNELNYIVITSFFIFLFFNYHISTNIYHWYWCHKAFVLSKPLEKLFSFLGLFSMVGDPISYTHTHRWHHLHSDTEKDPHSPSDGYIHSFFTWMFKQQQIPLFIIKDLLRPQYQYLRFFSDHQKKIIWFSVIIVLLLNLYIGMGLLLSMVVSFVLDNLTNVTGHDPKSKQPKNNYFMTWLQLGTLHGQHHRHPNKFFPNEPGYYTMKLFCFI
jgi:stearoyl-CoA desaturase (delta-9 desaturase)